MRSHWIDGRPSAGKRSALAVLDPATGELLGSVARGTADDADRAVRAARAAFPGVALRAGGRKSRDAARGRPADARAPPRARDHHDPRGRQALLRELRRGRVVRGLLRLLRRGRTGRPWQLDTAGGAAPGQLHDQGAVRCRRRDRALELPAPAALVEGSPGARRRQHGGREAVRRDATRDARSRSRPSPPCRAAR